MITAPAGGRGIVVDASAVVPWFLTEEISPAAERLLESSRPLLAPNFMVVEVVNAILTQARRGKALPGRAESAWQILSLMAQGGALPAIRLFDDMLLFGRAIALSEQKRHPLYDCFYLVLAQREDAALATFDRRLAAIAAELNIPLWATQDPAA